MISKIIITAISSRILKSPDDNSPLNNSIVSGNTDVEITREKIGFLTFKIPLDPINELFIELSLRDLADITTIFVCKDN